MDKRFFQSIGITWGRPRWQVWLSLLAISVVGTVAIVGLYIILYTILSPVSDFMKGVH
jgi:hypothetical protein